MPRYMVERTFPGGLEIPSNADGANAMAGIVSNNAQGGVTWITSYVTNDKLRTVCIYDGPTPEAIRKVAGINGLPIDSVTPVRVLDPYFYYGGSI